MRRIVVGAIFALFPHWALALAPNVTGYEIAADPQLIPAIKPLKPKFLANLGKPLSRKLLLEDVRRFQLLGTVGMVRTGQRRLQEREEAVVPDRS